MKKYFAALSALALLPSGVLAAGIQVTPEKLEFALGERAQTREIIVANPTGDVQLYEVYADSYTEGLQARPASFTLEAGGRKKVAITANPQKLTGMTSTHISVIAKPLADSRVQVNTGVKIPITVSAPEPRPFPLRLAETGIVLAATVVLLWIVNKYRRRRKRKQFPTEDNRVGEKQ